CRRSHSRARQRRQRTNPKVLTLTDARRCSLIRGLTCQLEPGPRQTRGAYGKTVRKRTTRSPPAPYVLFLNSLRCGFLIPPGPSRLSLLGLCELLREK